MFIHELWHVIFAVLLGIGVPKITLYNPFVDKKISGYIEFSDSDYNMMVNSKYKFKKYFISISPILSIILAFAFSFYSIWGIVFLIYNILFIKTSLPSVGDLSHIFLTKEKCIINCISELESIDECIECEYIDISINEILNKENQLSFLLNISLIKKKVEEIIQLKIRKNNCSDMINEYCNCQH